MNIKGPAYSPSNDPRAQNALERVAPGKAGKNPEAGAAQGGETRVELSSVARELQAIGKSLEQLPDVDQKKVDELRAQIAAGDYQVDADKVAEKLLQNS